MGKKKTESLPTCVFQSVPCLSQCFLWFSLISQEKKQFVMLCKMRWRSRFHCDPDSIFCRRMRIFSCIKTKIQLGKKTKIFRHMLSTYPLCSGTAEVSGWAPVAPCSSQQLFYAGFSTAWGWEPSGMRKAILKDRVVITLKGKDFAALVSFIALATLCTWSLTKGIYPLKL